MAVRRDDRRNAQKRGKTKNDRQISLMVRQKAEEPDYTRQA